MDTRVLWGSGDRAVDWDGRMGRDGPGSTLAMEEPVEEEFELSLARQVCVGSANYPGGDDSDWFVTGEHDDSPRNSQEQDEGSPGGRDVSWTQEEVEMEADSASADREVGSDEKRGENRKKAMAGAFDACLWPMEEDGGHVRISLEEVERYYRFSCRCHWLCGT